jgi:predicted flap endonuclease-1-like 5' DNA nuclease
MLSAPRNPPGNRTAALFAGLGLGLVALAVWGFRTDVVWISQAFYAYMWWAWILFLDAFCIWRRRSSLLTTRRHLLGLLATSSVTFWFVFEALNLRFSNWYYVGTFELDGPLTYLGAGLFTGAAFATVFIGMFEVFDALGAARVLTRRSEPHKLPAWLPWSVQVLGLVMAALAILFPFYLAPLIWGSLTFLLDPWNYRRGNRSLLRDFEAGDGRAVARLFLAGLISGLVWESLNFVAPQKWIYTVRGLEDLKLFEMPLLGFLGFPALAFDAVTGFSMMSFLLCDSVAWEHPDDLAAPTVSRPNPSLRRYWKTLPLQLVFCIAVTIALMPRSVGSVRLRIERLPTLATSAARLEDAGFAGPRELAAALTDPGQASKIAKDMDWSTELLTRVRAELELFLFKGIGARNGVLLEAAGVETVEELSAWTPEALHTRLEELAEESGVRAPRLDWVRVWVLASRSRGVLMRAE